MAERGGVRIPNVFRLHGELASLPSGGYGDYLLESRSLETDYSWGDESNQMQTDPKVIGIETTREQNRLRQAMRQFFKNDTQLPSKKP